MNWREVVAIYRKELVDSLRDRRTWTYSIILPVILMPLLMLVATHGLSGQQKSASQSGMPVAVQGLDNGPALVATLQKDGQFQVVAVSDLSKALTDRVARVGMIIPEGFESETKGTNVGEILIRYDHRDLRSEMLKERLVGMLQEYSRLVVAERLSARGVDLSLLQPVAVGAESLFPRVHPEVSTLALMLPMFLALWGAVGGMHVAIDLTAGERERGTLEPLLSTPVSPLSLMTGKYLTVLSAAVFSQAISLFGFSLGWFLKDAIREETAAMPLAWPHVVGLLVTSLALSALFAGLEIAVGINTRTVREAQSFQAPISFAVMIPWLLVQFLGPADVPAYLFWLPIVGNLAVYKELVLGSMVPVHLVSVVITCGVAAYLAISWSASRFQEERVLFRA